MAMLAENHALPHNRGWSLSLETKYTKHEAVNILRGLKQLQSFTDELIHFETITKHNNNMIYIERQKAMLSDMKTEIEHIFQSTDIDVLQEYLRNLDTNNRSSNLSSEKFQHICLFYLITYHVLVTSEKENSKEILNAITCKLLERRGLNLALKIMLPLYLDMFYKDNPNKIFTSIYTIWKKEPTIELELKLVYCEKLMEAKDNKTLKQLIHNHADYFIEIFEENEHQLLNQSFATMILLHILQHKVSFNKMEKVKTIQTILSRKHTSYIRHDTHLSNGFSDFLLTMDNKQQLCTPYVLKLLQSLMKEQPFDYLSMILLSSERLRQANHYTECIKFIKCHFQFISSFPTDELKIINNCYYRQQYCITLLLLLNEFISCHDTHNINLMLTKLIELRVSFLPNISSDTCYCYMGHHKCSTKRKETGQGSIMHKVPIHKLEFQYKLLRCYQTRLHSSCIYIPKLYEFDLVMYKVIQGELELAPYLQSIIDIMSKNMYKDESVSFLIEFIERSANKNEESLYNIVKTLCAFDLQPEVEDLILQGLNAYLMISCNIQYGILSKFILDVSMICPKGQFLYKISSGIAKSLFKFDDNAVKDFNNIIYKCYCTVRHDCRNETETNITKYKNHFTFIASMEAEEEMKKLTTLTNFLLMLTLLLMESGGHHKSAELKKYLSLKYEYEDSILYLLWCSGDVEINPGPTFRTLRKVPDSVKERNWIYEMCSMLLRLLKFKSIDIIIDGLWKERPLNWPVDSHFYDPRNKPKGKGYSIETDRKLLETLEEQCNGKKIFEDMTQLTDKHTKSKIKLYQKEITAWKTNNDDLFELYILRQEQDILLEAKRNLQKYKKEPGIKEVLSVLNEEFIFDSEEDMCVSNASYTDIVRDLAITFCRIGKGLNPLHKSDNLWQMPPSGWYHPKKDYFSPCNAGQRGDKCTDKELVHNLLSCCETKIEEYCTEEKKPVLIKLLHAWKNGNVQEVRKYHTIWSNMEVIDHSLKYLKLEGLLAKSQTHLEKLGIKPKDFRESAHESTDLSSPPFQDKQNNPKCPTITQSHQENHFDPPGKLRDSDASQKVVPLTLMGSEYQETDQTSQNKTNKRKHQSTDVNYTEPKKLHGFDIGKPLPVDSSSCKHGDNVKKKGETTLDQYVNQILIPFEEQDYSSVVGDSSIPNTSSTTDQQSDLSNELPVYVELYINRIQKRSDTTLIKDIEQLIDLKEQDIDSS